MVYVPGFTNDIFISFAHVDNLDGWVEEFQKHLRNRLLQIEADVTIWRDEHKLRGTDVFSDEIFEQLQQSALLISIVSPTGIKSHWCQDERQAFERFAALNGGFRLGNTLRAIKVVKTPLSGDKHRDLFGTTGFEFYRREEPNSDLFEEFVVGSPEFRQLRDRLALNIKRVLDAIPQHRESAPKRDSVYVATTTTDLTRNRERIVQQLEDWGYAVVPQEAEPLRSSASFKAVAKAELTTSIFSVHLASDQSDPIVEGGQDSIVTQYDLAQELRKDRIVWVEPGRVLHSSFQDAFERGLQNGVELVKDRSIEKFKEVIAEKLNRRLQSKPSRSGDTGVEVYLLCDTEDYPSPDDPHGQRAQIVKEYLEQNGLYVMPPPFTDMESDDLEIEHQAELQSSTAVLLYWGVASEKWFRKTRRLIVNERTRRSQTSNAGTLIEAYYFTSPETKKPQYRHVSKLVFQQYNDFDPNELQPLLDRLLANEEGR